MFDALAGAHNLIARCCWRECRVVGRCDKADVVQQRDACIDQGLQGFQAQEIDIAHQNAIPVTLAQPMTHPMLVSGVVGAATFRVLVQLHTAFKTAFRLSNETRLPRRGHYRCPPGAVHRRTALARDARAASGPGEVRHASSIATEFLRWIQIRH